MIYGPKDDCTYVVEFRTADGEALAISIPRSEARVIRMWPSIRGRSPRISGGRPCFSNRIINVAVTCSDDIHKLGFRPVMPKERITSGRLARGWVE
jgi:hypothetical protein